MKRKYTYKILLIITLSILAITIFESPLFAWSGTILDKETGSPIEGAVIARSWNRVYATPAGSVSSLATFEETLSDKNGKFSISIFKRFFHISIPFFAQVIENRPIVFKPGYKFLVCKEKDSVIKLEKIPTFIDLRKKEVRRARENYEIDFYETDILQQIISKEEEFIESPIKITARAFKGKVSSISRRSSSKTKKIKPFSARLKGRRIGLPQGVVKLYPDKSGFAKGSSQKTVLLSKRLRQPTVDELIKFLKDPNTANRRLAARKLAKIKDLKALPYLIETLQDEDARVRSNSAFALGELRDIRPIEPLITVLSDKNYRVANSVVNALIKIGKPAVEPLIDSLTSDSGLTQLRAAKALGGIQDQRAIDPLIRLLLQKKEHVSSGAAIALGNYREQKIIKPLIKSLGAKDTHLRTNATEALIKIGPPVLGLLYVEINSPDPLVRREIVWILRFVLDARSIEPLVNILQNDPDSEIRKKAAFSLTKFKESRVSEALLEAWRDKDYEVRKQASQSLVIIGEPSIEPLFQKLKNTDSYVRWRTAWCLGRIRDPISLKGLIPLLNDKVSEVKWAAIDALESIGDERAIEFISQKLNDNDLGIRDKAKEAILKIKEKISD